MARLAAQKEFAYMKALNDEGFPVPCPVDQNRHCVVMSFVDAMPLCRIKHISNPSMVMERLMRLLVRLGRAGIVHGDFNEFNLMIDANLKVTLIDFPQIVHVDHPNAEEFFDRDVQGSESSDEEFVEDDGDVAVQGDTVQVEKLVPLEGPVDYGGLDEELDAEAAERAAAANEEASPALTFPATDGAEASESDGESGGISSEASEGPGQVMIASGRKIRRKQSAKEARKNLQRQHKQKPGRANNQKSKEVRRARSEIKECLG